MIPIIDRIKSRIRYWSDQRDRSSGHIATSVGGFKFKMSFAAPDHARTNGQVVHFATKMRQPFAGEWPVIELIKSTFQRGWSAIDVGAWMGPYTLLFSRLAGPDGKVFALEPDEEAHDLLVENIRINELKNVSAEKIGLSDYTGPQKLIGNRGYGLAESHLEALATPELRARTLDLVESHMTVDCTTLDRFVLGKSLPRVDVIKMDIEGAEKQVIEFGKSVILSNDVMVVLELHNDILKHNHVNPEGVVSMLEGLDMDIFHISQSGLIGIDQAFYELANPHLLALRGRKRELIKG